MPAKGLIGGAFPLVMIVLFLGAVGLMFGSVRGIDPALAQPDNLAGQSNLSTANVSSAAVTVCLPIVVRSWPPAPETPLLNIIDNADADNYYTVSWSWSQNATSFILEEANDASFSDARVVFEGSGAAWTVPGTGKTPGTCHYRVKARNQWADSAWSNVQYITIYPMFVGLSLRWDGEGYIRGDEYYNVGTHHTRDFTDLTALDTVRAHSFQWYDPNPQGWDSAEYDNFYSVSTGYLLASSLPSDPSWKWRYFGIVPYDTQFYNGQEAVIDGQVFTVSGPLQGYTAFGQPVQYWQLVNRDGFLYWDGGGDWTQRVHPGDITLWYDAGATRLLLKSNILRRYYYQGNLDNDTVQYIQNLTYANSFPGMGLATATAPEHAQPTGSTSDPEAYLPERGPGLPR